MKSNNPSHSHGSPYLFIDFCSFSSFLILAVWRRGTGCHFTRQRCATQQFLTRLEIFLRVNHIPLHTLRGIAVQTLGGGFTDTRMATVYGNMLSRLLTIPIFPITFSFVEKDWKESQVILPRLLEEIFVNMKGRGIGILSPEYTAEPNITLRRKTT